MAFNFSGTFNVTQYRRLADFARDQYFQITPRIQHLEAEILRIGSINFAYDEGGSPTGFSVSPSNSYLAKLLTAYEVLGGDALYDLNLRNNAQAVFLLRADETSPAQMYSNGDIQGGPGLADAASATLVQQVKYWMAETLAYKRDRLERKIRRAVDYSEQLQKEADLLRIIQSDVYVDGSLEALLAEIEDLINDPTYRAVTTDETDPFGKRVYAPMASYQSTADGASASTYQRQFGGVVAPGETQTDVGNIPEGSTL